MGGDHPGGDGRLELRLLGPLDATRDGVPIAIGGAKPRALLAALALEVGRVVSVDRLVEALWPGETPDSSAHAIHVYVSQLRKVLGPVIATRTPGYTLEIDDGSVDVHRFAELADAGRQALDGGSPETAEVTLREALSLWRGAALADFAYEPFAQNEIARLEELRATVLEDRIQADLALGRHLGLVSELEALIQAQPLRERARAQLMLALYRSGRQADALASYRDGRELFVEELGIEPGPELRELEAAILRQDDSLLLGEEASAKPRMQYRRFVTILFVDIVESMALAETLDAEALAVVLNDYFETVSAALARHGGTVEKFAGDAVMAAFGIPVSHEDDALRAARAAVDIRSGLAALNERLRHEHDLVLEVRTGLETGEVVATPTSARERLVTGEAVGIAARLEQAAESGEIVVGARAGRLIDHAAELDPLGELAIKGRREPLRAYRLVDIAPSAPAFARRTDAPLVGRKRELAAFRRSLKRAIDRSSAHVLLVTGSPGVGKSRLAAEFTRRTKRTTTLLGRCLSYGDGITYWPLREVLAEAPDTPERDAIVSALEAETPPPAPEIAWLFRQFCETQARRKPLVLVFDDVQWAEPTFLELVEHLCDKGEGAVLLVCLAREELLETRPAFLSELDNAERVVLDALSTEDTDALLDGLGGALESDQRARILETAEGNPLFAEQLHALALEGGLAEGALPETIQALLAARLDRLGPGERAVLERGAVVGKEFSADHVAALLDPEGAPMATVHLAALADRGFVRSLGETVFAFRHHLVQEAVYRAAPKRIRADLHERFADELDAGVHHVGDVDELIGYHLEQAFALRTELGERDRRTARLAEDGGRRLGGAGVRALKRGDMHATVNLLDRSTKLLPPTNAYRCELLSELGIALRTSGDTSRAVAVLATAMESARAIGDRRIELRARLEHEYVRLQVESGRTAEELLASATEGIPVFESLGDDRSLGRAWLLTGFVQGGHRGRHRLWEEAAERALVHYRNADWPTSTCLGELATALYFGPTPVPRAVARCEELLEDEANDRAGRASVRAYLGGLVAQLGRFDDARLHLESARAAFEDLGQVAAISNVHSAILSDVELLAGDSKTAERLLHRACDELESRSDFSHLASRAGDLAEALFEQGELDAAQEWVQVAERHSAPDDVDARLRSLPVRAKIAARRGDLEHAYELVRAALALAQEGDDLNRQAHVHRDLGHLLRVAGREGEAAQAFAAAVALYEQRGNIAGVARAQASLENLATA